VARDKGGWEVEPAIEVENAMLIIAGYIIVPADRRQAYVEAFAELVVRARAHPGCLDLAITADAVDPARVNNYELWQSEADLDAWRKVSHPPKTGIPIESGQMMKYFVSGSAPPF
jgi:quinol monooxygenase YgiN